MGSYVWYCGDLRTGRIYTQIPLINTSWTNTIDDAGAMRATADLNDPGVYALNLASAAAPAKTFLAVAYVDDQGHETFIEAGPVWFHNYDDDTGMLDLTAAGLWSYFDHRKVIQVLGALNPAVLTATYSGMSLGTIAKRLVQLSETHTGGDLPIVYQSDEIEASDAAHTRTYPGYALAWIGDELRNLTGVIGGPEIAFRPRRQADARFIEWFMATGTEEDPLLHQTGADWTLDASVPKSNVLGIGLTVDGTQMGDEAWARGNGSEIATIIGHSLGTTLTDEGYPLLEVEITGHESAELVATVNGYAQAATLAAARPAAAFTVRISRDGSPSVAQVSQGDYVKIVVQPGHRYLTGGGSYRSRVTMKSGDDSSAVVLQLAPIPGSF